MIPLTIFPDDTVEKMIAKIVVGIQNYEKMDTVQVHPWVWSQSGLRTPLRHFVPAIKDMPLNPWKAVDIPKPKVEFVQYLDQEFLPEIIECNIVFAKDLPREMQKHPYYFPDAATKWELPTFASLQKENDTLLKLWEMGTPEQNILGPGGLKYPIHRAQFVSKTTLTDLDLAELFERCHTSSFVPFLQYVGDAYHILYKLHKQAAIPIDLLRSWTAYDRISAKISAFVFYSPLKIDKQTMYARITLEQHGNLAIYYPNDPSMNKKPDWSSIEEHVKKIVAWLEPRINQKIVMKPDSVSMKMDLNIPNMDIRNIANCISAVPSVFHVSGNVHDGVLDVICKRSRNYRANVDIADLIQTRVEMNVPLDDIMADLLEYGLSEQDIQFWMQQVRENIVADVGPKKKTLTRTGCFLYISSYALGIRIQIHHAASKIEADRIIQWLRGILIQCVSKKPVIAPAVAPVVAEAGPSRPAPAVAEAGPSRPAAPALRSGPSGPSKKPTSSSSSSSVSSLGSLGSLEMDGGAIVLDELVKADPTIFKSFEYTRKCSAIRQPIVISKEEKARLDQSPYAQAYDNAFEYGSDVNNVNVYMCPRVWCPISRIPMTIQQFENAGEKCPNPNEKPVTFYKEPFWRPTSDKPIVHHFIGELRKHRGPNGLCLPCCFKNLSTQLDKKCPIPGAPAAPVAPAAPAAPAGPSGFAAPAAPAAAAAPPTPGVIIAGPGDEHYIMGQRIRIPEGRYGSIPRDLHHVLLPNIDYSQCSKNLSTLPCFVRKGIPISHDPLLTAIAISMGYKNKQELIQAIEKILDPIRFLSLEHGNIARAFSPNVPIDPNTKPKLLQECQVWKQSFPSYRKYLQLDPSAELALYVSHQSYLQHLRSADPKSPHHLLDLLHTMGYTLLIWRREGLHAATLHCPQFTRPDEILPHLHGRIIMLLYDEGVYEPIEYKMRGKKGELQYISSDIGNSLSLFQQCSPATPAVLSPGISVIQAIVRWIDLMLSNPAPFQFDTIVLRADLHIYGFLTRGNVLIKAPDSGITVRFLPELLKTMSFKKIVFHEDLASKRMSVLPIVATDFEMLRIKLVQIGFQLEMFQGSQPPYTTIEIQGFYLFPIASKLIAPVLLISPDNSVALQNKKEDRRWIQLQRAIGKTLWTYYDTLVQPLLTRKRSDIVKVLKNTFPWVPEKDKGKLHVILEEIPFQEGTDAIAEWLRYIEFSHMDQVYRATHLREEGKEYVFSQAAVDRGLPWYELAPTQAPKPQLEQTPMETKVVLAEEPISKRRNVAAAIPYMLKTRNYESEKLPSKFSEIKRYSWKEYSICKTQEWTPERFWALFQWLGNTLEVPYLPNEIRYARTNLIASLLQDENSIQKVLADPAFLHAWSKTLRKKVRSAKDMWNYLKDLTYIQRKDQWYQEVSRQEDFKVCEVDLYVWNKLLGVNILLIHRSSKGAKAAAKGRGEIEDLGMSTSFYTFPTADWDQKPLILFQKEKEETMYHFYPIVNEKGLWIHPITKEVPKDIYELLQWHQERIRLMQM